MEGKKEEEDIWENAGMHSSNGTERKQYSCYLWENSAIIREKKIFKHNVLIIMVNPPVLLKSKLTLEEKKH